MFWWIQGQEILITFKELQNKILKHLFNSRYNKFSFLTILNVMPVTLCILDIIIIFKVKIVQKLIFLIADMAKKYPGQK